MSSALNDFQTRFSNIFNDVIFCNHCEYNSSFKIKVLITEQILYQRFIEIAKTQFFNTCDENIVLCIWILQCDEPNIRIHNNEKYIHLIINNGLFENIIDESFSIGIDTEFLPFIPTDGQLIDTADNSTFDWCATSPINVMRDFDRYKLSNNDRMSLINIFLDLIFIFCIDHEICHLNYHRPYDLMIDREDKELLCVREMDADAYAANACFDFLFNDELENIISVKYHKVLKNVVSTKTKQETFRAYLFIIYVIYASFRSLSWKWEANFDNKISHPPLPFRFKCIIALLIERELQKSGSVCEEIKIAIQFAHVSFHSFAPQRSICANPAHPTSELVLDPATNYDADVFFKNLYKRWTNMRSTGVVGSWL